MKSLVAREFDFDGLDVGDIQLDELDLETPTLEPFRRDAAEDDIESYDFVGEDGDQTIAPIEATDYGFESDEEEQPGYDADPAQDYWAREGDESVLVANLESQVEQYRNYQRSSAYWRWIIKNWQYAHNLYFDDQIDSIGISALGDMGELVGYSVNHFRNLLQHLLTLTTRDRPALTVRARNSDAKSLIQSRLGKSIVETYLRDEKVEKYLKIAVEHALVFAQGYIMVTWEPTLGEEMDADENGQILFEGDVDIYNPTAWDVFYDLGVLEWDRQEWVIIRRYENKWNLVTKHPTKREEIFSSISYNDDYADTNRPLILENEVYQDTDQVETFWFYHKRTEALPEGRFVKFVNGAVLIDEPLPFRDIPIYRITAGELLLSPFGYTPAFDLQAPQEIINQEASAIASNHKTFGIQNVWTRTGDNISTQELEGGLNHVQSNEPPQALNLTNTPPEIFTFMQQTVQAMEYLSGVNSVARGQPEQALRAASGAALALIDAKAVQFASGLLQSYHQAIEAVGTQILYLNRDFAKTERVISIIGKYNRTYVEKFSGKDLEDIDRVVVESVNPVLNTYSGRIMLADKLLESQLLSTPEEYINVIQTGQIETMLEAENAQLAKIRDENENLLDGGQHEAAPYDNHVLHIKEHHALINSVDASLDKNLVGMVAAAITQHVFLLKDFAIQEVLQVMGYPVPLPPTHVNGQPIGAPAGGPPAGGPPAGGGGPGAPSTGRPPTNGTGLGKNMQLNPMNPNLDRRSVAKLPGQPAMPQGAVQ